MNLCSYFLNGNCRFGSKCVNDHIDVKTLIKNESEAVIQVSKQEIKISEIFIDV